MSRILINLICATALALCLKAAAADRAAPLLSTPTPAPAHLSMPPKVSPAGARSMPATRTAAPIAAPAGSLRQCTAVEVDATEFVMLGKSSVVTMANPVARMMVGAGRVAAVNRAKTPTGGETSQQKDASPLAPGGSATQPAAPVAPVPDATQEVVQITLLSPTQLFFLGTRAGSTNVVLQDVEGRCRIKDVVVGIDPSVLQAKLAELMPQEKDIRIKGAENALVLTGRVSDAMVLDDVVSLATSYGDGKKVVNLLRVSAPQQVMLEVKIAEISKTLLDRFNLDFARLSGSATGGVGHIASGIFGGAPAVLGQFNPLTGPAAINGFAAGAVGSSTAIGSASLATRSAAASLLGIDAQRKDGLVRILAEPNIMAISGQSASFLSGGKIFIPVAQSNNNGATVTTLEEKEFGVGLKFTPIVLDGSRISLKVVSEVSELSQTGSPFTTVGGATAVLPSVATRRVDTTVQLNDGQSFAVAGLIRNNVTETISRFPGVGDVPLVGALFRSTEFQNNQTELIFVVTPRLVKPMTNAVALPTDFHVPPTRLDVQLLGKAEGTSTPPDQPVSGTPGPVGATSPNPREGKQP